MDEIFAFFEIPLYDGVIGSSRQCYYKLGVCYFGAVEGDGDEFLILDLPCGKTFPLHLRISQID